MANTRDIWLCATSALMLVAAGPVMAQDQPDGDGAMQQVEQAAEAAQDAAQAATETAKDVAQEATQEMEQATDQMAEGEGQMAEGIKGEVIAQQPSGSHLASVLMDAEVMNAADEEIGDVNDMIVDAEGTITGLVIGVGGFLGVGEKEVAVEMSAVERSTGPDGAVTYTLDTTAEELGATPAFERMAMR